MKLKILKELFLEKLNTASRFTSSKLSSLPSLQGILLKTNEKHLHFYSTNLSFYFHTKIKIKEGKEQQIIIEPKKIIEFISLLPSGYIDLEIKETKIIISSGKTRGSFSIIKAEDFPLPPKIGEKKQKIKTKFLIKNLPKVLFTASKDEGRPALTGINFIKKNDDILIVSTDGFRLSLINLKAEKETIIKEEGSFLVPAVFLEEVIKRIGDEDEIQFAYSQKDKTVFFKVGEEEFYSRLIDGEFPPFEKVIPEKKKTTVVLDKEEFLRNIKLVSVFARELSNIVVLFFTKKGLELKPKIDEDNGTKSYQEIEIKGEDQQTAFNYRFLVDLLNNLDEKQLIIEMVRPDAPVVFKTKKNKEFLHVIMPIRLTED